MSELLFECYNIPSVCYGIDGLFSYFYNKQYLPQEAINDSLVISSGYLTTHHLPLLNNQLVSLNIKRYN